MNKATKKKKNNELKNNTHRRRRRDATVELRRVGGVYWALQCVDIASRQSCGGGY